MATTPAENLQPGDVIDAELIFQWFKAHGIPYDEKDADAAQYELQTVEDVRRTDNPEAVLIVTDAAMLTVPEWLTINPR